MVKRGEGTLGGSRASQVRAGGGVRKSPRDLGACPGGSCSVAVEGLETEWPAGVGHQNQTDQDVGP